MVVEMDNDGVPRDPMEVLKAHHRAAFLHGLAEGPEEIVGDVAGRGPALLARVLESVDEFLGKFDRELAQQLLVVLALQMALQLLPPIEALPADDARIAQLSVPPSSSLPLLKKLTP